MASLIRACSIIALCAFNVRTVLTALGAGGSDLELQLNISGTTLGTFSSVSILLIALGSLITVKLVRRTSVRFGVGVSLAATGISHFLLALNSISSLWLAVTLAGLASGILGALLPTVIRLSASSISGIATGVMIGATAIGVFCATYFVTLSNKLTNSWRLGTLILALIALLSTTAWSKVASRYEQKKDSAPDHTLNLKNSLRVKWLMPLVWYFGLQSFVLFAQIAWLVPSLRNAGLTALTAGSILAAFSTFQVVSGVLAPIVAQHYGFVRTLTLGAALLCFLGTVQILLIISWGGEASTDISYLLLATLVLSAGHGATFALTNFFLLRYSATEHMTTSNSSLVMLVGHIIGSFGPLLFGVLNDFTNTFTIPWIALLVALFGQTVSAVVLARRLPEHDKSHTNYEKRRMKPRN